MGYNDNNLNDGCGAVLVALVLAGICIIVFWGNSIASYWSNAGTETTALHKLLISDFATVENVKKLLDAGLNIDSQASNDLIFSDHEDKWIVAEVNKGKASKLTPLMLACITENLEVTSCLLDSDADVTMRTGPSGYTALHYAARNEDPRFTELLIKHNANVNAVLRSSHSTPLLEAAKLQDSAKHLSLLVEAGANVNAFDSDGYTTLHLLAAFSSNADRIKFLLKNGADPNAAFCICDLSTDVVYPDPRVGPVYFENVCENYYHNHTPLMVAAGWNKNLDVLKTLLEAGASIRTKLIANGYHISNKADEYNYTGSHGKEGKTALMWAAERNQNPEVIKLLIESGADLNATTASGVTPLMFAAARNNAGVVKALLKTASPGKTIDLQYNLHESTTTANEFLKLSEFDNALEIACEFSYSEVVNVLLDAGIQPTQRAINFSKLNNQISDEVRQRLESALPIM
jgi:ankyrin repeat protein